MALALVLVAAVFQAARSWERPSAASPPAGPRPQSKQPVIVWVRPGGFDWGDAAIGAAGAIGLVLLVHGLALGTRGKGRLFGGDDDPGGHQ